MESGSRGRCRFAARLICIVTSRGAFRRSTAQPDSHPASFATPFVPSLSHVRPFTPLHSTRVRPSCSPFSTSSPSLAGSCPVLASSLGSSVRRVWDWIVNFLSRRRLVASQSRRNACGSLPRRAIVRRPPILARNLGLVESTQERARRKSCYKQLRTTCACIRRARPISAASFYSDNALRNN